MTPGGPLRTIVARTWIALALTVAVALAATSAWGLALRSPSDPVRALLAEGPPAVREAFASAPSDPDALARIRGALGADVAFDEPPPFARRRLDAGFAVPAPGPGPGAVWVPLPDGRVVRLATPPPRPPPLPLLVAALLGGLGVVAAWQLRPLDRALSRLADAAERMGRGDLDVRVGLVGDGPAEQLGRRFDEMAERIGALVRGRTELLLAVSHELRTPLQRVRVAIELLADARGTDGERRALADRVERDLDELDALVEELLDWGRLESGPPRRAEVDLVRLLADAAERARSAGATDVSATPEVARCAADPAQLRRAVGNLAENAARHGRGAVRLAARAEGDALVVTVDDDGPGVPVGDRARIFEPFVRLDEARSRGTGGAGLGLAIVARVAAAHGGAVDVADAPGGGARFGLVLPAALTIADTA